MRSFTSTAGLVGLALTFALLPLWPFAEGVIGVGIEVTVPGSSFSVTVQARDEGDAREVPLTVRAAALRIVQEVLQNAARHARASAVTVEIVRGSTLTSSSRTTAWASPSGSWSARAGAFCICASARSTQAVSS